ncbi:MAG: class I SAM-dependent methyltransferase [Myxococcales bacterium]|nr:MAG: class I SAM-dependent methyltransferase [Myxococcales bacterium]
MMIEKACRSRQILEERERLVPQAAGRTLELGVGTGLNLPFYSAAVTEVIGVDPSAAILDRARDRAAACRAPVTLVEAPAESLPWPDGSFDSVVVTYTLCSVGDPVQALREARRVLRPDGRLFFVEHGLARATTTRAWQHLATPAWKRIAGNCHLDRDIPDVLYKAGFDTIELRETPAEGLSWTGYTYEGIAIPG